MDLVHALEKAASAIPSVRQAGESELKNLESQPGFHIALLSIYGDDFFPNSSRSLAIIYLKNAVERQWRRSGGFTSEEKQSIREKAMELVVAPATTSSKPLFQQLAVVISIMARTDFPRVWPQLLGQLHELVINTANANQLSELTSALEAMHQTLKRLATARIGAARIQLNEFSVANVGVYYQIYRTFGVYSALKITGTLLYAGHDRAHRFPGPRAVFGELLPVLQTALLNSDTLPVVSRIGKIYERLLDRSPLIFCGFGSDAANVARFYAEFLNSRPATGPLLQSMVIIRELSRLVKTSDLKESSLPLNLRPRDSLDRQDRQLAYEICQSVFSPPLIEQIITTLIESYFAMGEEDLELWRDDPAEFVAEESRQNPEFSVVLCAELLFAHLLKAWPSIVAPKALVLIETAIKSEQELVVEGALRALQFGAPTFTHSFTIEPILHMLGSHPSPVIRRRLCLVVGSWIPVCGEDSLLMTVAFQLVESTLSSGQWDVVVQLGALHLTQICCDDIDFRPESFQIAADPIFLSIYRLLQSPHQSPEVKLSVLRSLSTIIEGLDAHLTLENVTSILQILPALWESEFEHSNHHLIQGAVLQTLARLVVAKGSQSLPCYEVAVPLCELATDPSQPISMYLLEDALELWKALVMQVPSAGSLTVTSLVPRLAKLVSTRTEYLAVLLPILESYLWLQHEAVLPHLTPLLAVLQSYLTDGIATNEAVSILQCVEVLLLTSFASSASFGAVLNALQSTNLLNWIGHQVELTTQFSAETNQFSAETNQFSAETNQFSAESLNPSVPIGKCLNVLSLAAVKTEGQAIPAPSKIFPGWLNKIAEIADPRDRKLACMGLCTLLLIEPALSETYGEMVVRTLSLTLEDVPDTYVPIPIPNLNNLTEEEKRQHSVRSVEFAVTVPLQGYVGQVAQTLHQQGVSRMGVLCVQMGVLPEFG